MAKQRTFRAPFVLTLAAAAATQPSCGGKQEGGSHREPEPYQSGNPPPCELTGTSCEPPPAPPLGNPPLCELAGTLCEPEEVVPLACDVDDVYATSATCTPDSLCLLDMSCTHGPQTFTFRCANGRWELDVALASECMAGDGCGTSVAAPGYLVCSSSRWWHDRGQTGSGGANPPAPCPATAPTPGSGVTVSFGFDSPCSYTCASGELTVFTGQAKPASGTEFIWVSDGACDQSMGGAGGGAN